MSVRGTKRASGVRRDEAGTSKRRRVESEDALWQLRPVSDLKMSSIYNRNASEAPAELFRKDFISMMKLADTEPLTPSDYWIITDTWKQDWERGVQVPVNPDSLPAPKVKIIKNPKPPKFEEFKLPKDKYIHLSRDAHYLPDKHVLSTTPSQAESACSYDLDATDMAWLKLLNAERARAGATAVTEDQLEKVIEELEVRTWDKIQSIIKSEEGLGLEYDENVICDVCRSPDSEDGNEMVFCDECNICVHQACYGITVIPEGQWLCRPCRAGVKPNCVLCPNVSGAMKCTPSGHKWAHVSCVLWIPEVSIGCAEKMEPITKIGSIPQSRWSLVCVLCRERKGACIQCSVKTCKTAYHVTCAFKYGLEMRAIIEDENADDGVKLRSYCQKHSVNSKKEKCPGSGEEEEEAKRKRRKDMTSEEKNQARAARLQEIEAEFDEHIGINDISSHLDVDQDAVSYIYNYWKLKRRAGHNRPLLPPKSDNNELLTHRQEQADLEKMKKFVQLRQDLERVRNLCYMVSRREKLSRSYFRMREQTFHKQIAVLSADSTIPTPELTAIIEANHGPSIYDRLYSGPNAPDHENDFDDLLARIAPQESSDDKKRDRNGLVRGSKSSNPYKKLYVNGSRRGGMYAGLSSEESGTEIGRASKYRGRTIGSSTDEDETTHTKKRVTAKKKISPKGKGKKSPKKCEQKKKKVPLSKAVVGSSSDDEKVKTKLNKDQSRSKTLQQLEQEMAAGRGDSVSDSDDLIPIRSTRNNKFPVDIYSDSSESNKESKMKIEKSPTENDSMQSLPRTKAAMKEFIPSQPEKKSANAESNDSKASPKKRGRKQNNKDKKNTNKSNVSDDETKENIKFAKQKDNPTDLIVPQRQAAKKASENMRSTTASKKDDTPGEKQVSGDDSKNKQKLKAKEKEIKDSKPAKISRKKSSKDQKETIAYVPQRQAAKKAAAHIKSGLGAKAPVVEPDSDKKKENERLEEIKSPKKEEIKPKIIQDESSSSSSNSSSSSYTSSSSSDEINEKPSIKPTAKAREIKPFPRQPSMFSPPGSRPTVDLPFLDKVSKPLSSTSASSDSDSSKGSRYSITRPRRRRKAKTITDESTHKTPDKKLKTSERRSECGASSPAIEGEESSRTMVAVPNVCTRTRSTAGSGNMSDNSESRARKSPRIVDVLSPKQEEGSKSIELTVTQRETDETIKDEVDEIKEENIIKDEDETFDKIDTEQIIDKIKSPSGSKSPKEEITEEPDLLDNKDIELKSETKSLENDTSLSVSNLSPIKEKRDISDDETISTHQNWLSQAPSPHVHPPPVEKPGDHEKYMTEDKSLDVDFTDRSSIRMIAKIQANLNENTMIKSPKTPMDARTLTMDTIDVENTLTRNNRKSTLDKKFIAQDSSHVQGVEISKSAKIPSALNTFPSRNIYSPQPRENDHYEIEVFPPYSEFIFKEDSKEQGAQETLNLVDRLRMQLSSKKVQPENFVSDDGFTNDNKEIEIEVPPLGLSTPKSDPDSPKDGSVISLIDDDKSSIKDIPLIHHVPNTIDLLQNFNQKKQVSHSNHNNENNMDYMDDDKDAISILQNDSQLEQIDKKYDDTTSFTDDIKEPSIAQSDINSISEVGDSISISKQSDDSQSLSVVDHSIDNDLTQDNHTYDNNNSVIHSDCATVSSPYLNHESKWQESKITTRRSSASSTNSDSSVNSQKTSLHISCDRHRSGVISEIERYPPIPPYSHPLDPAMSLNQYANYPQTASPYLGPMVLPIFPPGACPSSQLSLSSTAPGLYVPSLSYSATSLMPPLPKPIFSNICAAFTTSSQNIALTRAMIASPTSKPLDSPSEDIDVTGSDKLSINAPSSPSISVDSFNDGSNTRETIKAENTESSQPPDSKSPLKVTKQNSLKLSGKSPGISPKQVDVPKGTKRPSNRSNRTQRGRGRSKSRAQGAQNLFSAHMENSIQSKLVGTVYDFEEEIANDGVDLKALRDRRKSIDVKDERKSEHSFKESSQSPQISSPQSASISIKEDKDCLLEIKKDESNSPTHTDNLEHTSFSHVQPVLPGPVDMRTYNASEIQSPAVSDVYHSHLLEFASGTADQHLPDIDEEVEKQLHTALKMASNQEADAELTTPIPDTINIHQDSFMPQLPKVSLSDSRNQLKVKIKGPFLDANYSASSAPPAAPKPPAPVYDPNSSLLNLSTGSVSSTGSTNLRRMRKKELLRQYWTQDMNMDDPANTTNVGIVPPPVAPQPLARAVITIPKAVASMTSIPTREDYKMTETAVEKKKRKSSALSRELRQLNSDIDLSDNVKLSKFVAGLGQYPKRRTRVAPSKPSPPSPSEISPVAPKLKIKIGSNLVQPVPEDSSSCQFRPPKKRLQSQIIPTPSMKDLKRESMIYRRMVMADFEEDKKPKKPKKDKGKKKKDKKLLVVNSDSESATKLIIKIKRQKDAGEEKCGESAVPAVRAELPVDPFDYDPSAPDPLAIDTPFCESSSALRRIRTEKVTPIRLKRSSQGSGYVMKKARLEKEAAEANKSCPTTVALPSATIDGNCTVR
ncbi:PHD finger protein rhinoceros [Pieris brassicae]|uniref:PHD finger protein rhinoceros n=1 Tax=Pieris brassicae TaxID=7116 RepID=UPI001E660C4A|nr:PHD finger protein rhinoceros [Pieris brassicae]XP_045532053.1 PHD finger protein rhinoceros [Pieris brassicae]XP_045532054.1 PHD finger protein rhinoceros [Pieris brassicae]